MNVTLEQLEALLVTHGDKIEKKITDSQSLMEQKLDAKLKGLKDEIETESKAKADKEKADKEEADRKIADAKKKGEDNKSKTPEQIELEELRAQQKADRELLSNSLKENLTLRYSSDLESHAKDRLVPGVEKLIQEKFLSLGSIDGEIKNMIFTVGNKQHTDVKSAFDAWLELPENAGYKAPPPGTNSPRGTGNNSNDELDPFSAAAVGDGLAL